MFDDDKGLQRWALFVLMLILGSAAATVQADAILSDRQLQNLQHTSQALLKARKARKEAIEAASQPDRRELQNVIDAVSHLERNARQSLYAVNLQQPQPATATALLPVSSAPSARAVMNPDRQSFEVIPTTSPATPRAQAPPKPDKAAASSSATPGRPFNAAIAATRGRLPALRESLQQRMPPPDQPWWKSVLKGLSQAVGPSATVEAPPATATPNPTAAVLRMVDEVDAALSELQVETDSGAVVAELSALKQRLLLTAPKQRVAPMEPTFLSRTHHRQ